jgi:hypothetical protein
MKAEFLSEFKKTCEKYHMVCCDDISDGMILVKSPDNKIGIILTEEEIKDSGEAEGKIVEACWEYLS